MKHEIRMEIVNWAQGEKFGHAGSRTPTHLCHSIYEWCSDTEGVKWLASFDAGFEAKKWATAYATRLKLDFTHIYSGGADTIIYRDKTRIK